MILIFELFMLLDILPRIFLLLFSYILYMQQDQGVVQAEIWDTQNY